MFVWNVGDILYLNWNNQYYGEKCKVIKVNEGRYRTYNIKLLKKQDSWLRSEEGKKVVLHFSNVEFEHLKKSM
jgi:hypothetical protein